MNAALNTRADGRCELCGADSELSAHAVAPHTEADDTHGVVICGTCAPQLVEGSALDPKHWFCLQEAIWSEVGAVQVLSWRLLNRLQDEGWARDLLEQAYLADDVLEWAKQGVASDDEDEGTTPTVDSNGTVLSTGDSVSLIRSLDVKGTSFVAKRGTTVRGIRVTDDPTHVEGRVNGVSIYLKTCFLKKIG